MRRMTSLHQNQSAAIKAELVRRKVANPNSKPMPQRNSSGIVLDWERKKIQQKPIYRTYSQSGYRPRSDSLRRIRSIQRHRLLERSKAKSRPPSQRTAKMEAENKKIQEEKALLAACARGDLNKVEKLVDSGVDVNSSDQNQMTALHYAAMHTRDDVIKSLISRGAEVNIDDLKGGFSAIHWVIINATPKYSSTNHLEGCLTALTEAGCRVNATDFNYATPLHIAAQKGNKDSIPVLLRLGADPNKVDINGRNCFEVAKNQQIKTYMKALVDIPSKKDHLLKNRRSYHVLETPPPSFPAPLPPLSRLSYTGKSSQEEHFYHTLKHHSPPSLPDLRPPSVTSPPPSRLSYTGKSSQEEHFYHTPEHHTPPSSPPDLRPTSVTSRPSSRLSNTGKSSPEKHFYHTPEHHSPPSSTPDLRPTSVTPPPPSRLSYTGKSSQEEHFYHTPEHHSPPSSPPDLRPTSITPPPLPHHNRQYKQQTMDSHLYHILEPIPARKSKASSPPRRRKSRKH